MLGHFCKQQLEILVGIKAVCFGCFSQAVYDGTGFGTLIGFGDHEVLAAYGKRLDRLFGTLLSMGSSGSSRKRLRYFPW